MEKIVISVQDKAQLLRVRELLKDVPGVRIEESGISGVVLPAPSNSQRAAEALSNVKLISGQDPLEWQQQARVGRTII